jgi:hypothetical protein
MIKKVTYSILLSESLSEPAEMMCPYVITGFMISTAALFAYIGQANILFLY